MNLYVDYTNHRGERGWRHIDVISYGLAEYPPVARNRTVVPCLQVYMQDRKANRTLALTSCHQFVYSDQPPPTASFNASEELRKLAIDPDVHVKDRIDTLKFLMERGL